MCARPEGAVRARPDALGIGAIPVVAPLSKFLTGEPNSSYFKNGIGSVLSTPRRTSKCRKDGLPERTLAMV